MVLHATNDAENIFCLAIDDYFREKSTIHGIQVGWAQGIIARRWRNDPYRVNEYYEKMGLQEVFNKIIPWSEEEFDSLIPYSKRIRNRYTIFNTI